MTASTGRDRTLLYLPDDLRSDALKLVDGVWCLEGRALKPGDTVEVRRAQVGTEELGDEWALGVVGLGQSGLFVELEEASDFVPGSRGAHMRAAGLRTLRLALAEIRRA